MRIENEYFFCSILGMNIFGCKFCKYIEVKHSKRLEFECSRKNFDSLLWATLTVFQVIEKFFETTIITVFSVRLCCHIHTYIHTYFLELLFSIFTSILSTMSPWSEKTFFAPIHVEKRRSHSHIHIHEMINIILNMLLCFLCFV